MSRAKRIVPTPSVVQPNVAIFTDKLTFSYKRKSAVDKKALTDISLTINKGEFVALVGHTGSGKSTFVQHLNALVTLQQGSLNVLGHDLAQKKPNLMQLRKQVGMVFQYPEYQLFADTVLEDVCFGPKNFGVPASEHEQLARKAIELVGLDFDEVKSKSPFDLSGGEKRRVAFAGVLVMQPQILVLDEPTAGLDPQGKREILQLVRKLNREQGVTVIMVSHDMNEVYENADRVIVFSQGRLVYDLPPRELFRMESQIEQMNLEVPQVAAFCNVLEQAGIMLPVCRTVEQVCAAVVALKEGGNA